MTVLQAAERGYRDLLVALRGLIARTRLAKDRRSYHLTLTPAGDAMLERLTECAERHERNLERVVGKRDRAAFMRALRAIMAEMD